MVGGPASARVLDLFAGRGLMRQLAYQGVAEYCGVDRKYQRPGRECIKANNLAVLSVVMGMAEWNIFDLDAYANPWPLFGRVVSLCSPGRKIAVLTDGTARDTHSVNPSRELLRIVGWSPSMGCESHGLLGMFQGIDMHIVKTYLYTIKSMKINYLTRMLVPCYTQNHAKYYMIDFEKNGGEHE